MYTSAKENFMKRKKVFLVLMHKNIKAKSLCADES